LLAAVSGRVAFAGFCRDNFQAATGRHRATSNRCRGETGAVGIKIWKNIGMSLRDPDGRYVMLDDSASSPSLPNCSASTLCCSATS